MSYYYFCKRCVRLNVQPTGIFQPNEHFDKPYLCKQCDPECVRVCPKNVTFSDEITRPWPSIQRGEEQLLQDFKTLCLSD